MTRYRNLRSGRIPKQFRFFLRSLSYSGEFDEPVWNALPIYMKLRYIELDETTAQNLRQERIVYFGEDLYKNLDTLIPVPSIRNKTRMKDSFIAYMKSSGIFYVKIDDIDDYEFFEIGLSNYVMIWICAKCSYTSINSNMQHQPYL
jgi:hypothetical protein